MIDMVVVNLYAFEKTVESGADFGTCIENIDIGGPSMLRSAAKNFASVAVVTDPNSYGAILAEMKANDGATTLATRTKLALRVFQTTNAYDGAIATWLSGQLGEGGTENAAALPETYDLHLVKQQGLRYGENPHQDAMFYRLDEFATAHSLVNAEQLNDKELSYNNILDTDACWSLVREFDAYDKAFACDPKSAFGGIIAANVTVSQEMVEHINENKQFIEVVIAPDFEAGALELLQQKKNVRVLRTGGVDAPAALEFRSVDGGMLAQSVDRVNEDPAEFTVPTKVKPTDDQLHEMLFAWKVCKGVKSNAILVSKDHAGIGMGPGQPHRMHSSHSETTLILWQNMALKQSFSLVDPSVMKK